ncbi:DUF2934 domain-containing protein [Methylicorpusculum sp.]|uniref:DUF2934 domain-containing protein n=1 Tax=Methylicorpusculum sp. TaxID=2713644 RepID=UPI002AB9AD20|nr:DUF2934 domain-containing protein [Methylicorpusculum sp.]MDZ4149559.1 DUF2934 domain-containing protein [Methylicorpusculum sp.]
MTDGNSQQNCPKGIDPDEFHQMVSMRAYCKAEARNFAAGYEQEDWFAAEREIAKQCHYRIHPAE